MIKTTQAGQNSDIRELAFNIRCVPPKSTSQQKGIMIINGQPRHFKKKAVKDAENTMIALLAPHAPLQPFEGAIELYVKWTYPWRSNEAKCRKALGWIWKYTRPDCSNSIKLFEDCMTKLLFWNDDSQVARLIVEKQWGDNPGFEVKIKELRNE